MQRCEIQCVSVDLHNLCAVLNLICTAEEGYKV